MAYFSNGTGAMDYEAQWCDRCVHQDGPCSVWLLHLLHNYDQFSNARLANVLGMLIPRSADGLGNEQCTMFVEKAK